MFMRCGVILIVRVFFYFYINNNNFLTMTPAFASFHHPPQAPLHACVSARTWAESNVPGGVSLGMAPVSANQRGASTSATTWPMGSQRNILLFDFLVEGRRHEHLPPTILGRPGDRPRRLSNEVGMTRDGPLPPVKREG